MSQIPTTAQAWRLHKLGHLADAIQEDTVPTPSPGDGEVLVKLSHASLNPVDYKIVGLLPRTVGADFSGEIVSVAQGSHASWVKQGVRVYGIWSADKAMGNGRGSLSTYLTIPSKCVAPIPPSLDYESAAGIALTGLTAFSLNETFEKGWKVFIVGGSTSVGLAAADIAKAKGASLVVASASGEKKNVLKQRGVDEVIDYKEVDVAGELSLRYKDQPFDVIFDCVGDRFIHAKCPAFLKPTGEYRSVGASSLSPESRIWSAESRSLGLWFFRALILPSFLGGIPRKFRLLGLKDDDLSKLDDFVQSGQLRPVVDKTYPWNEAREAIKYLATGRALGKVNIAAPVAPAA
ncbi:NAD(P)-binding protein [Ceraceosorus guamensis]|uniref:NAD(P)-binding protein n=1 Tax=Ceraceosorus guamensis TaxID=1522189 RepID=A0A316VV26_9BASI|nr:NAD(P)-binding protein [Ceraceosorus guamensis]PWN40283.1 NAD(P)-binding protein [Ceraceosorus guamensis]